MKNLVPSILILSAVILLEFPQTQCFKASIPMDLAGNSLDDQYVGNQIQLEHIPDKTSNFNCLGVKKNMLLS
ncbi:erythroblast NAD(P)(+)--arginine ADP-ribosyltransferase-like [Acipenser oxyrinchus oxyrinchus]|uniref:Erythroblast NAD(P)(+)--arginine ADP-ribosyltransferase-like n=1 Tax=Acipenser oxyrinchus oxyrinchus TaxID=40147 RepID=A0AAD8CLP1_ACIOX|nr:erythroblast NAD(P)(+)--arginine ADP-ribosyltransferase-like [Acipenser oxyrinchus oxyrinchus]KAK1153897.1 erythroblast NAD(P)(+)--arginine ADP-ribosyltransferase-like [Acipenser oxyrinchus oxyrinchus]